MPGMTRTRATTALLAAGLLALTACGSSDDSEPEEETVTYEVITEELPEGGIGQAELLMPDATVETAEAAIRQYAETIDGPSAVTIGVVRSEDAGVIVCRADWPDLDETMNCPDPGGS
jgi:hypothetical protein